jgi:hypothetical protein
LSKGKTYNFKVSYYKKGKLICAKTVKVKKGDVVVTTTSDKKCTKITVSWTKVNFAKGYEIYRSETKGSLGKKIKTIKKAGATKYIEATKNLQAGKKYYYQVRPYWNEDKKKKMGSSNQSSILCNKVDETVNRQVLLEKMGLKDKIAGKKENINRFGISESGTMHYPAIKYQFDGKKLTMHLYIQYSSYEFNGKYDANGKAVFTEQSLSTVLSKQRATGGSYVALFEKGLQKYYHDQTVMGSKKDFGVGVNFKTALVIHRQDNSKEGYHQNQKFIEVMVGGIDKYRHSTGDFATTEDPYWYYSLAGQRIYLPEDYQFKFNVTRKTPTSDYMGTVAHEMGHILGLADAYYDNGTWMDRCTENTETCIYEGNIYHNIMKGEYKAFVANDFEMMLQAYRKGQGGVPATELQAYKDFDVYTISEVIKNQEDKVTTYSR